MQKRLVVRDEKRIDVARDELALAFEAIVPPFNFNVFLYSEEIEPMSEKKAVKFSKRAVKKALQFVDGASASGRKDIWNALFVTITDGKYDTIYLLSSGEPDVGWVVHEEHLNYHLAELIRFHPVIVHTIAYTNVQGHQHQLSPRGPGATQPSARVDSGGACYADSAIRDSLLDRIAEITGGDSRHIE